MYFGDDGVGSIFLIRTRKDHGGAEWSEWLNSHDRKSLIHSRLRGVTCIETLPTAGNSHAASNISPRFDDTLFLTGSPSAEVLGVSYSLFRSFPAVPAAS